MPVACLDFSMRKGIVIRSRIFGILYLTKEIKKEYRCPSRDVNVRFTPKARAGASLHACSILVRHPRRMKNVNEWIDSRTNHRVLKDTSDLTTVAALTQCEQKIPVPTLIVRSLPLSHLNRPPPRAASARRISRRARRRRWPPRARRFSWPCAARRSPPRRCTKHAR